MRFGLLARFNRPHFIVASIVWMIFIFYMSHQPSVGMPGIVPHQDKLMHFVTFGILGLLSAGALDNGRLGLRAVWVAVGTCAVYGLTDEYHQSFVPGREVSVWDWVADCVGGLAGGLYYYWFKNSVRSDHLA